MDSSMIEGLSVTKLANILWHSEFIQPAIAQNDKTPSWDGQLFLYSTKVKKKENLYGKCNIQVKGKLVTSKELKKHQISFLADISDLRNYRSDGGVLYFVGYVVNPDKIKFYYGNFLPVDIVAILAGVKQSKQKKITVTLREFPQKIKEIECLIKRFIKNSRYQYSTTSDKTFDLSSLKHISESNSTFMFLGEENRIFLGEHYCYQKISEHIFKPLGKLNFTEAQFDNAPVTVNIDGVQYFDAVSVNFSEDGDSIFLGKCVSIINIQKNRTAVLKFQPSGIPQEVIEGLEFIKALKTGHILNLGNIASAKNITIDDSLESLDESIDFYKKIRELFQVLHVKKLVNMSCFVEQEIENLWKLYMYIVENKDLKTKEIFEDGIQVHRIGELVFAFVVTNCGGGKCKYSDFFDEKRFIYKVTNANGDMYESSIYTVMKKEQFVEWANIDYEAIRKSIFRVPYNQYHGVGVNLVLLEMLKAYDLVRDEEILDAVIDIASWLREQEKDLNYLLNYFQAIRRKRKLRIEEREELLSLIIDEKKFGILAGTAAILGNEEEYRYYLARMEKKEKEDFESYPITQLMDTIAK